MTLSWQTSVTPIATQHDAIEDVVGAGPTAVVHDQSILFGESRLRAEWGFRQGFSANLVLPLRAFHTTIQYLDGAGVPRELVHPGVHHRDETLIGIGDPWVTARAHRPLGAFWVGAQLGVSLPLGKTQEDPFLLGDMGLPHEHFQMGTGTLNPIAQLEAGRVFGSLRLSAWAFTMQVLYENGKGYQAGDRYAGGIVGRLALGERWGVAFGPEAQAETAERWHGVVHEEEGNQGRVDVLLSAEGSVALGRGVTLNASLKLPVYTHVVGGQLDIPAIASLGLIWSFGGKPAAAAAAAHAEEEPPYDPVLEPIPGTITVFDFWAEWCEPCHELDALMRDLAARHPGRFVVRRVDVTTKHIHFAIPRFVVFGKGGTRLLDRSAAPEELARDVEDAIK